MGCQLYSPDIPAPLAGPALNMSEASAEDEMGRLLRELLRSTRDRISGAPSTGGAEEVLLHLEETDQNFHK